MKRRKIGLVLIALCMLCAMSVTAMAATKEVQTSFAFKLQPGGERASSPEAKKLDYANYARIEFRYFFNNTNQPLYYRLRAYPGGASASGLYSVNAQMTQRPVYSSGYGIYDNKYFFRIQTDSSSTGVVAETIGIWVP